MLMSFTTRCGLAFSDAPCSAISVLAILFLSQ
jgi:hypothetical protein